MTTVIINQFYCKIYSSTDLLLKFVARVIAVAPHGLHTFSHELSIALIFLKQVSF